MGVKLSSIVPKQQLTFEELAHKVVGLDFSNIMFQFLTTIRQPDGTPLMDSKGRNTSALTGILARFSNLMEKEMKLVVVCDGKAPELKRQTQRERHERKVEAAMKYKEALAEEDILRMNKYARQTSTLTPEILEEAKKLVEFMGIPIIQSPMESDAQLAFMNQQSDIDYCASNDYDGLLFGAPHLVLNLTLSQRRKLSSGKVIKITPELIELAKVLESLNISREQLICLGILIGTDYHPGVHGIGPKKGLKLVQQHKKPEAIFKAANADFDWKEIMDLFLKMGISKKYSLDWQPPQKEKIRSLLIDEHDFAPDRVESALDRLSTTKTGSGQKGLNQWFGS